MIRQSVTKQLEGPRPLLPDMCHHAEYRIYLDGQYVESVGNLGANAQRAADSWQRKNKRKCLEVRPMPCRVAGCQWRPL